MRRAIDPNSPASNAPDPRNDEVLFGVNGRLVPRHEATVHVFDSGFTLGDGIGESS